MKALPTINILFLALALLALGAFTVLSQPAQTVEGSVYDATQIGVATTTTSVSVTSSTRLLATTTNALGNGSSYTRVYASICNPNANPVYVLLDGDKAASSAKATTVIAAAAGYNACYEITDRNLYSGSITASSTDQTATVVNVAEYVQ